MIELERGKMPQPSRMYRGLMCGVAGQLLYLEFHYMQTDVYALMRQTPAVNEKLAASLILLRVALRLGLSTDNGVFMWVAGCGSVPVRSSVLPHCSGVAYVSSEPDAAANSGSSLSVIKYGTDCNQKMRALKMET